MFDEAALHFIYEHSGGIPRRINHLCDLSLLSGFGKKAKAVDLDIVKKTLEDFGR
jgi:type II secretory pathway predicted ATPase ExeA